MEATLTHIHSHDIGITCESYWIYSFTQLRRWVSESFGVSLVYDLFLVQPYICEHFDWMCTTYSTTTRRRRRRQWLWLCGKENQHLHPLDGTSTCYLHTLKMYSENVVPDKMHGANAILYRHHHQRRSSSSSSRKRGETRNNLQIAPHASLKKIVVDDVYTFCARRANGRKNVMQ